MTYNTRLVSPKEVPKRYEDLLNPVWNGHLAMDTGDARWFGYMETFWGREKGHAPHENAAKLYYDFLLSDKGQELVSAEEVT